MPYHLNIDFFADKLNHFIARPARWHKKEKKTSKG
jgi:hypothetical protein